MKKTNNSLIGFIALWQVLLIVVTIATYMNR